MGCAWPALRAGAAGCLSLASAAAQRAPARPTLTSPLASWPALGPAELQQAPNKPFIKLETAAGPLILGFEGVAVRDEAVDLLKQVKPPVSC